jgi:coenzyme F420-0:L-glutamate ligase / coenzyme F420-1:gamma-L-glutamate ligase
MLTVQAVEGLPEVRPGDALAELILEASGPLSGEAILVVAHKVVSKAEGRLRRLDEVTPGERARELGRGLDKDPRLVQVVLDESREVVRAERGVLICVTRHGFVCANAGVDRSNVPGQDVVLMLPEDPDASARRLRGQIRELTGMAPGVLITDSFGRAWRNGQCDVALGCAGLAPLEDWRGRVDAQGLELRATWIGVADEVAAAADLARSKDGSQPAVVIHGAARHVTAGDGPGAQALIRPVAEDLFR